MPTEKTKRTFNQLNQTIEPWGTPDLTSWQVTFQMRWLSIAGADKWYNASPWFYEPGKYEVKGWLDHGPLPQN